MIIDSAGILYRTYKFKRIISLVPSLTELLSDLSLDEEVIGVTKFCVHPREWFELKPKVGGTKNVNIEMVHKINPDLIIANKEENVKEQVEELSMSYTVLLTDIHDLDSAALSILQIGRLTGKYEKSKKLATAIRAKFGGLDIALKDQVKARAAYLIWNKPYMVAGGETFINDMMHYCGLRNIFSGIKRYPEINLDEISERGCGIVLLSSEPYPFKEKHVREIRKILPLIKIVLADGEMFSWYGSRLLKAADYFELFHSKYIK